ncbi:MAG: hypothetical protein ABIG28_03715 [archaeon]
MVEEVGQGNYGDRFFSDVNTRIRDLEEKQRLLKDRMSLIGESFVKERDKNFDDVQDMRKTVEELKAENQRLKELLLRIAERANAAARKEDVMILQRQFDLFRD